MITDEDKQLERDARIIAIISVLKVMAQDIRAKDANAPREFIERAEAIAVELANRNGINRPLQNRATIAVRGDIFGTDAD